MAIDAKRILLRYGAPIAILDKVSESHRIEFAREIAKTTLPERERRLRQLLAERGYTDAEALVKKGRGKPKPVARAGSNAKAGPGIGPKAKAGSAAKSAKAKAAKRKR